MRDLILAAMKGEAFTMQLAPEDAASVRLAVNQRIDSHLEACYVPARGDRYIQAGYHLVCNVSPESMVVLIRRLQEQGDGSLAESILHTLEIYV